VVISYVAQPAVFQLMDKKKAKQEDNE